MKWIALCVVPLVLYGGSVIAQSYPDRPVRFVVPFSAGGNTDILARLIAQGLTERLGQQIVIDNRPGAGATIGTDIVARATPDGHTILMVSASHVINPSLYKKLPYDSVKDFAPVTLVADLPSLLVAHPSVPVKSVSELIMLAKRKPGELNYGSAGSGTGSHLGFELFKSMAGIDIQHVPYRGNAPATADLLGGQVHLMMGAQPAAMPHVRAGKVRPLGVTSTKRSLALPDVPAIGEFIPGYDFTAGFGVLAPAGTPRAILDRLSREIVAILQTADVREFLVKQGAVPIGNSPQQYAAYLKVEMAKMAKIVAASRARVD